MATSGRIPSTASMMEGKLNRELGETIGSGLVAALRSKGLLQGESVDYNNCGVYGEVELPQNLSEYQDAAVATCTLIKNTMNANYDQNLENLKDNLVGMLTGHIKMIRKVDLINPLSHSLAGDIYNGIKHVHSEMKEKHTEVKEKQATAKSNNRGIFSSRRGVTYNIFEEAAHEIVAEAWNKAGSADSISSASYTYSVNKGDKVDAIAEKHGISRAKVIELNPWLEKRTTINKKGETIILIVPGEELKMPNAPKENKPYTPPIILGKTMCKDGVCGTSFRDVGFGFGTRIDQMQTPANWAEGIGMTRIPGSEPDLVSDILRNIKLSDEEQAALHSYNYKIQKELIGSYSESNLKWAAGHLKKAFKGYEEFSKEYPRLAVYGASILSIAVKTAVAGPAGFANGVRGEVVGSALGVVFGDKIGMAVEYGLQQGTVWFQSLDFTLSAEEARTLAAASLLTAALITEGSDLAKLISAKAHAKPAHVDLSIKQKFEENGLLFFKKEVPDTVDKVGSNYPRNAAKFTGKLVDFDELPDSIKKKYPDLKEKYPESVYFNEKGFPDFGPYAVKEVKVPNLIGENWHDFKEANKAAGIKKEPKGYTWHHHEDGVTMQLVPQDIHDAIKHTGGAAIKRHEIQQNNKH